jgi:5-methylcytosine-specific restriction endonuclease McrA
MSKRKEPWEECPNVWKTPASYFQWIRGQMRLAWKRHPVKLKFIRLNSIKAPVGKRNASGLRNIVKAGECAHCHRPFRLAALQVDHIEGAGSFRSWSDFGKWMHGLMHVCINDLQFMCKQCHDTKTYAERHSISYEAAAKEKRVIKWLKDTPTKEQVLYLTSMEMPHNNAKARRNSYRALLVGGNKHG